MYLFGYLLYSHDVDLKTFWLINHSLLLSQGLLTMISFSHDFKCINAHIIIKKNQIFDWVYYILITNDNLQLKSHNGFKQVTINYQL